MQLQDWLDAGYRRYDKVTWNNADFSLQMLFTDDIGKRYYLTVYVYEHWNKNYHFEGMPEISFAPEVQFRMEDTEPTVNVELILHKDSTIEQVEDRVLAIWEGLGRPYYDKFDEYKE